MKAIAGVAIFLMYALISCIGLYWLKSALNLWTFKFISGAFFYIFGAVIWLMILRMYPLSIAFPIASGVLMIGTTLVGYVFLKEHISLMHVLGVLLISLGISILALQGKS